MIGVKRSQSWLQDQGKRPALRRAGARQWRLFSLLMLTLFAAVLMVGPASAESGGPKAPAKPTLNVVVIGDFYSYGYARGTDPVLQRAAPPTLQALNQIQAANPGVQINVLFIPVRDATNGRLYQTTSSGAQPGQSSLISAVGNANIVIVGVGVGNSRFADSMRKVLFGTAAPARKFPRLMAVFDDGSYLQAQTALLGDIAARVAPGASIVTLGYPQVLTEQLSSGLTWWSPYSWAAVSQQKANAADQLASALDTANDQATSMTAAHHPGMYFLYADLSGALKGTPSTQGAQSGDLKLTIIGNGLLPYIDQAVNNELTAKGVQGAANVPPITPASPWNLTVQMPVSMRPPHLPQHPTSNSGINSPAATLAGPPLRNAAGANPPPGIMPRLCVVQPAPGVINATAHNVCRGPGCRIVCPPAGSAGGAAGRLARSFGLPAPPAPLPKPIAPQHAPNANAGGGGKGSNPGGNASTNPSQGGRGNSSQGSTTSPGGGASSQGGTTSSGGGTSSSGSSGWSSSGSPSSGGYSSGGSPSSGGSSSGGSPSGGGSSGGGSF